MSKPVFIFAGPSLFGTALNTAADLSVTWLPPARRGDIERLATENSAPGVMGLADGTFHAYPSVSHIELREALQRGWRIYGLCSMGAIRVSEMRHMGMLPWGRVAEMFCNDPDLPDDEVALIHSMDAPFTPLSEPMIHIREFCALAHARGWILTEQAHRVIQVMRERWYGDRTIANLRRELRAALQVTELPGALAEATENFKSFRLKQADLNSFVNAKPWLEATS